MDPTYNPNGSIMPRTQRRADLDGPDYYPTPRWATHALIDNEQFSGDIWECACGDGAMAEVLAETGNDVFSSDLYDRGYGETGVDFLTTERSAPNIVTNPPYHSAEGFVWKGLEQAQRKLALLLRLAFLEGVRRYGTIFDTCPPSRVWVFSQRITIYRHGATRAVLRETGDHVAQHGIAHQICGSGPRLGCVL